MKSPIKFVNFVKKETKGILGKEFAQMVWDWVENYNKNIFLVQAEVFVIGNSIGVEVRSIHADSEEEAVYNMRKQLKKEKFDFSSIRVL